MHVHLKIQKYSDYPTVPWQGCVKAHLVLWTCLAWPRGRLGKTEPGGFWQPHRVVEDLLKCFEPRCCQFQIFCLFVHWGEQTFFFSLVYVPASQGKQHAQGHRGSASRLDQVSLQRPRLSGAGSGLSGAGRAGEPLCHPSRQHVKPAEGQRLSQKNTANSRFLSPLQLLAFSSPVCLSSWSGLLLIPIHDFPGPAGQPNHCRTLSKQPVSHTVHNSAEGKKVK